MTTSQQPKTALYFATVCALPNGDAIVSGHLVSEGHEPTATIVLRCGKRGWHLVAKFTDIVYAMTYGTTSSPGASHAIGILGRDGRFAICDDEHIRSVETIGKRGYGYLEGSTWANGSFYACGADGQVFRRTNASVWTDITSGVRGWPANSKGLYVLSVAERRKGEIVVCGSSGFAAIFDGSRWRVLDLDTNMDLHRVWLTQAGVGYFCGAGGTLLRMNDERAIVNLSALGATDETFHDICEYAGRLYIAAGRSLLTLEDDRIEEVGVPGPPDASVYRLAAYDSLWCVGDETVRQLSGDQWTIYESPTNRPAKSG
jgi:photosystem II stability/assembly factor-like uncharacterized protein